MYPGNGSGSAKGPAIAGPSPRQSISQVRECRQQRGNFGDQVIVRPGLQLRWHFRSLGLRLLLERNLFGPVRPSPLLHKEGVL